MIASLFRCLYVCLPAVAGLIVVGLVVIGVLDRRDDRQRRRQIRRLNALYYGDSAVAPEPRRQP